MLRKISFPSDETEKLQKQSRIITTRVSREYNKYHKGDIVITPWEELYFVHSIKKINDIKNHPYYIELSSKQIKLLSKYKKIDVIELKDIIL